MARTRRNHTLEFKREAVRLVREEKLTQSKVSENLGIDRSSLSLWCRQAEAGDLERPVKSAPTPKMEDEFARLRKENRILKEKREILKKAAAFFARENR